MNTQFNKESMITSLEWLKEATEMAFEKQAEPVYKKGRHEMPIVKDIYHTLRSDIFNIYEKNILIAFMVQAIDAPMTPKSLVDMTKIHISSVKRAVKTLKSCGILVNHSTEKGFILNRTNIY